MGRLLHHSASSLNGVARPADAGHRARPAICSIHDAGIHFLRSSAREHAAATGIEERVVLKRCDGSCHRVESAPAGGEHVAPRRQGAAQAVMV